MFFFFGYQVVGVVIENSELYRSRLAKRWFVNLNTPRLTENEAFQMMSCVKRRQTAEGLFRFHPV